MNQYNELYTDFLVIGSGIAGLFYALEVSEYGKVLIITKKKINDSNTKLAQGGIAAVWDKEDSIQSHIDDTIRVGRGLCKKEIVEKIISKGKEIINDLVDKYKVDFAKNSEGQYFLGMEGGHSYRRILYKGDFTGLEIEEKLIDAVKKNSNITILENFVAVDLITDFQLSKDDFNPSNITCYGIYALDKSNKIIIPIHSKITLIATGGVGGAYEYTTNSDIATGDGIAMAYRAGANIANMEFIQFHPTTFYNNELKPSFLITEAVRGEGGILYNKNGKRFMADYDQRMELAPRDVVARAIDHQIKSTGEKFVYLDITHINEEKIKTRFPKIYSTCLKFGIDITKSPIPVVPAAHYLCGGICTDINGKTNINRLFVAGEAGCTGLHGANRLASNSLLEGAVIAKNAAHFSGKMIKNIKYRELPKWLEEEVFDEKEWIIVSHNRENIKKLMWEYVGIARSQRRLDKAFKRICIIKDEIDEFFKKNPVTEDLLETRNIATIAKLIIYSALERKESRGAHFNIDFPRENPEYQKDTIINRFNIKEM